MNTLRYAAPPGQDGLTDLDVGAAAELILPAELAAVGVARSLARDTVAGWGVPAFTAGDVVLVVSELIANAVREGARTELHEVLLRLTQTAGSVVVQVGDHNPAPPPEPGPVSTDGEHGRGLVIAGTLSVHLCWYCEGSWKLVWAEICVPGQRIRRRLGTAA